MKIIFEISRYTLLIIVTILSISVGCTPPWPRGQFVKDKISGEEYLVIDYLYKGEGVWQYKLRPKNDIYRDESKWETRLEAEVTVVNMKAEKEGLPLPIK